MRPVWSYSIGGFNASDKSAMRGFKKVEDLMNVRGIGEKSFLKLKPLVTVGAAKGGQTEQ